MKASPTVLLSVILTLALFNSISILPEALGGGQVSGAGWLSGWQYRKAHTVTGSIAGEQFNYPMILEVHYDSGADVDGVVYLEGKCRMDFGDVRFTGLTGDDNLDYWIQWKVDGVYALFWVEMDYIPQNPNHATILIYYGNPNASTTSNKDWTLNLVADFEDGTDQGWSVSWNAYALWDGVSSFAFEGNYSRHAGRRYGGGHAGCGGFYERFQNGMNLVSGSYRIECAARHEIKDRYRTPRGIRLLVNGIAVDSVVNPSTYWHWLSGNFTLTTSTHVMMEVEFYVTIDYSLINGGHSYFIDNVLVRKWCDPEPTHGVWGTEETYTLSSVITLTVSTATIALGENTTLSGSITPTRAGAAVTIHWRPWQEEDWETLTTIVTDENGQYSCTWVFPELGTYELKAAWLGDENTLPAESSTIILAVVAQLPPPIKTLSIKLSGEHDYAPFERVEIRVTAYVKDARTNEPVSGANVTMEIYDPEGNLWISDNMTENLPSPGFYEWKSSGTINELMRSDQLWKGVYFVYGQAAFEGGPEANDILQFHVDPPAEESASFTTAYYAAAVSAISLFVLGLILVKRHTLWRSHRAPK